MPSQMKMSLKAFNETVNTILSPLSAEQLSSIIKSMAKDVLPSNRNTFIAKINIKDMQPTIELETADILDEIESLQEDIQEKIATEGEEYYYEDYDEDDSLAMYAEFVHPMSTLFDKTDALFDYGHFEAARGAYEKLFAIFDLEDDYGRGIRTEDVENTNVNEAADRYLRAVYLTDPHTDRHNTLLNAMEECRYIYSNSNRSSLKNIIEISTEALPEFEGFLENWIQLLEAEDTLQSNFLLREAVYLKNGITGLENLAHRIGQNQPRVFYELLRRSNHEKIFDKTITMAQQALNALAYDLPIKAAFADEMLEAAKKLGRKDIITQAQWLSFQHKPTLEKLLILFESEQGTAQKNLLQQASVVIESALNSKRESSSRVMSWENDHIEDKANPTKALLLHSYLLGSELTKAFELVKDLDSMRWNYSDNPQAFFIAFIFLSSTNKTLAKFPKNLAGFWDYATYDTLEHSWGPINLSNASIKKKLELAYQRGLSTEKNHHDRDLFDWCLEKIKDRIHGIVSNTARSSYGHAALLTMACTEMLKELERSADSGKFYLSIKQNYPRHSAFQKELRSA